MTYWTIFISLGSLVAIISLYDDYGITWDESVQSKYGELVVSYFRSGFTDTRCNEFLNLRFYSPLFEAICALLYAPVQDLKFEVRHACIAVTAVLTIPGLVKFARLFRDPLVAVFSSLALLMLPRFVGHSFNNSKDIPFACLFVWAMAAMATLFTTEKRRSLSWVYCGVAFGLVLSVRVGGILLFVYYLVGLTFLALAQSSRAHNSIRSYDVLSWFKGTVLVFVISWAIMVMFWPWAHGNVVLNPLEALRHTSDFQFSHRVLFEGETIESVELPWYYLAKYLVITTPPALLVLAVVGFGVSIKRQAQDIQSSESVICFVTQLWLLLPLAYFMVKTPNVYDGLRHFLFVLPAIAVFVGLGATSLYRLLRPILPANVIFPTILLVILLPLKEIVSLHPYQMTYFNGFVGGLAKANTDYETDYWLSSYKEAAEWINKQTERKKNQQTTILLAANRHSRLCAEYYLKNNIKVSTVFKSGIDGSLPDDIDYYIATTRHRLCDNFPDAPIVHTIGKKGAVFTMIKGRANNQY